MSDPRPTRQQSDLAEVLELVLDKGIVINADIAVTVGDTELLGIELRAAIASFETAAEYGLAFPSGTDMRRVDQASGREPLEASDEVAAETDDEVDLGIEASEGGNHTPPRERPDPEVPTAESEEDSEAEDTTPDDADTDTNGDDTGNEDENEREDEGGDT